MKFYQNQLLRLLTGIEQGKIKSLLLYGPNRGFISVTLSQLIKKFNFFLVNLSAKEASESNLKLLASGGNFFKQRELLKIDYNSASINNDLKEFLLKSVFPNFICFIGEESLPLTGIRKFFESTPHLAAIGCYLEDEEAIGKLATSYAAKYGKNFSSDALLYLRSTLKGEHQILKSELDKLFSYTHDRNQISYEDVKTTLSLNLTANSDEMCVFFSRKQPELFIKEIEKLKNINIGEVTIIRALIRYYINLFIVISKVEDGQNIDVAIKSLSPPIFFKNIGDFKRNVQTLSSIEIIKIIKILQNAELKLKRDIKNLKSFDLFNELYLPIHIC